jgi:hypothetical protein
VNFVDPLGLEMWLPGDSLPQEVVDFSAGLGDALLFGLGPWGREQMGIGGVNQCSDEYSHGEWAGISLGLVTGGGLFQRGYKTGWELSIGKNLRLAPFGNRTRHPTGELPHYHRRVTDSVSGQTVPGQGIGRHRPWDTRGTDQSFWDRF